MKNKIFFWAIFVAIISGWVAFGIEYVIMNNRVTKLQSKIVQLESEISSIDILKGDVEKSDKIIDEMINSLQKLKVNLEKIKKKMGKGVEK